MAPLSWSGPGERPGRDPASASRRDASGGGSPPHPVQLVHLRLELRQRLLEVGVVAALVALAALAALDVDEVADNAADCAPGVDLDIVNPGQKIVDEVHGVVDDVAQKAGDRPGGLLGAHGSSSLLSHPVVSAASYPGDGPGSAR